MTNYWTISAVALLLTFIASCGGSNQTSMNQNVVTDPPDISGSDSIGVEKTRLTKGLTCQDYRNYMVDLIGDTLFDSVFTITLESPAPSAPTLEEALDLQISDTNNQEIEVDEADIVKTSANGVMYIALVNRVVITNNLPPEEMTIIAEIDLGATHQIKELLLDETNQRLIVISYAGVATSTRVLFYDVSNTESPTLLEELAVSGYNDYSRLVNEQVLLISKDVLSASPILYEQVYSNELLLEIQSNFFTAMNDQDLVRAEALEQQGRAQIDQIVAQANIDELLPFIENIANGQSSPLSVIDCEDVYLPDINIRPGMTTIYRMSTSGEVLEGITTLVSPSSSAYISDNNIYLYQLSTDWWWSENQADETAIHQISFDQNLLDYVGSGLIPGSINNRFSMSEYENDLRVATTEQINIQDGNNTVFTTINHMNILRADGNGQLNIIGSTDHYAEGERIFSSRFAEDRGYVVTFRQVDPLFTFDLSNPTAPTIVGELKIPGFSEYIHLASKDRLITIGQNGDDNNVLPGVRLQLFDVKDLSSPVLLHSYVPADSAGNIGYAWSAASYDNRAFTYVDARKLLVVPLVVNQYLSLNDNFTGFLAIKVSDANGFEEIGRIDHDHLLSEQHCPSSTFDPTNCSFADGQSWIYPLRSIIFSNDANITLFSLSNIGIQANDLSAIDEPLGSIIFEVDE